MTETPDGRLWFGTDACVKVYDGIGWTTYEFEDAPVHTLCATTSGDVYAGT